MATEGEPRSWQEEGLAFGEVGFFAKLPADNVELLISFLKNNLRALAKCASTCRFWKFETGDFLNRVLHCRACRSELLHRRHLKTCEEACFQDGPAMLCNLTGLPFEGMGLNGLKSFDGFHGFEGFHFKRSRKKISPIPLEDILAEFPEHNTICQSHFVSCKACGRFLGIRAQITREAPFEGRPAPGLDVLLLCMHYLLELDGEGVVQKFEHDLIFHCSGSQGTCGAKLFRRDSVLSEQHTWRKPGSVTEQAWYLNNFIHHAVNVGRPQGVQLAQGMMETADVWCSKCDNLIGWKFVRDLCAKRPNIHFVHRFGVCESSILELASEVDSHSEESPDYTDDEEYEEGEEGEISEDLSVDEDEDPASQETFLDDIRATQDANPESRDCER